MENTSAVSGVGRAFGNLMRGVVSLLETGSWHVEQAADSARSAKVLLDRVDEEVEIRAQRTLDDVNDALTEYGKLQRKQQMLSGQIADWNKKATDAATKAKSYAVASEERAKWENLAREALKQKAKFAGQLKVVDEALSASKPDADRALELVQEIGLTREQALSQRDALQITNATAQAKLKLANARQNWGKGSGPGQLLEEARRKVDEASAKAAATEQIGDAMPKSADEVSLAIGKAQAEESVDKELADLMA